MDRNTFHFTLLLLQCYVVFFSSALSKNSIETDESALLAFKSHITLDSNSTHLFSNWTEGTSVCSWIGVRCSSLHHRVVALNVSNIGLEGTIPPHIGNLSFLTSIIISNNNIQGQLPEEIAKLRRLKHISFSLNHISGEIPGWFGSLPNLQFLNLRNNSFSGSLPSSLSNATKLEFISLSSNLLNGNIPEELGKLKNLWFIDMQSNQLGGSLPLSFLNLSSLQVMAFTSNRLSGALPLDICTKLTNLAEIDISDNQLSGHIQSRFNNCSKLQVLSLSFNNFTGPIPREVGNLTRMVELYCGFNPFEGEIPPELGNLRNLELLSISQTTVSGEIPVEIGNLQTLNFQLDLSWNHLSGPIPSSIFNLSSMSAISLAGNNLIGSLPHDIGLHLPNLQIIDLASNGLTGVVPNSISNLTKLIALQLNKNKFTGAFPTSLGNLKFFQELRLYENFLTTNSFGFLESLTRCRSLTTIEIGSNPIDIQLPPSIGNFSNSLFKIEAADCRIRGSIPSQIGNLSGLLTLSLGDSLTVVPPPAIQRLSNLQYLDLGGNKISGVIPNHLCNLKQLNFLYLERNELYGEVPECFGNVRLLTHLSLYSNGLNSTLPGQIGNLENLLVLDVHSNFLSGNITPSIGSLRAALHIDLSNNKFSGDIPQSIGGLVNTINLSLAGNQLQGPIPVTFKNLLSIERLDLSHNNLTGEIPAALEKLTVLKYFNVSFNHLRGRVPSNGSFLNFTGESFMSNDALCGGPSRLNFPLCITDTHKKGSRTKKLRIVAYIIIPIGIMIFLICATLFAFLRRRKKAGNLSQVEMNTPFQRVSYYEIQRATDGFNESNLLGLGSFGSVYKAVLGDGTILAVKVFNQQLERALRSFETECEVISNIRHRNLLKVISSCSNLDFKALVLEYMPNGSLEKWLYSHNHFLDFLQRLNIMLDVASALVYMHYDYSSSIVHCDLKPSNVLLDEEMTGHVSDFGISKLLAGDETMVRTMTLATIGYTAPEYGSEGLVSTRCDVYSFGILLMETFTRIKPTDEMFEEGWGLRELIKEGLQNSETKFIDQNLMNTEDKMSEKMVKCIALMMKLALKCAMDSPGQRVDMKDVLVELQKIKLLFMSN